MCICIIRYKAYYVEDYNNNNNIMVIHLLVHVLYIETI